MDRCHMQGNRSNGGHGKSSGMGADAGSTIGGVLTTSPLAPFAFRLAAGSTSRDGAPRRGLRRRGLRLHVGEQPSMELMIRMRCDETGRGFGTVPTPGRQTETTRRPADDRLRVESEVRDSAGVGPEPGRSARTDLERQRQSAITKTLRQRGVRSGRTEIRRPLWSVPMRRGSDFLAPVDERIDGLPRYRRAGRRPAASILPRSSRIRRVGFRPSRPTSRDARLRERMEGRKESTALPRGLLALFP